MFRLLLLLIFLLAHPLEAVMPDDLTWSIRQGLENVNRLTYDYRDATCILRWTDPYGYRPTYDMAPGSYQSIIRPVVTIMYSNVLWAISGNWCNLGGSWLWARNTNLYEGDSHYFAGYPVPGTACAFRELARTEDQLEAMLTNREDGLTQDQVNFIRSHPEVYSTMHARFEGDEVLCVYFEKYSGTCSQYSGKIKCVYIPLPPTPPPFCEAVADRPIVRAVVVRENQGNTYDLPLIRIIVGGNRKICADGSFASFLSQCRDGSHGTAEAPSADQIVPAGDESSGPLTHAITAGSIEVKAIAYKDKICAYISKAGNLVYSSSSAYGIPLGCFRRPYPSRPNIAIATAQGAVSSVNSIGLIASISNSSVFVSPKSATDIQDLKKSSNMATLLNFEKELVRFNVGSFRASYVPRTASSLSNLVPKRICSRFDSTSSTTRSFAVSVNERCSQQDRFIYAYLCNNDSIVYNPNQCANFGGIKSTFPGIECLDGSVVPANEKCSNGFLDYQDDPNGDYICLRGYSEENQTLFVASSQKIVKKSSSGFIPVRWDSNAKDYIRVSNDGAGMIDPESLSDDQISNMHMVSNGIYWIDYNGGSLYKYDYLSFKDNSGSETQFVDFYSGSPFFANEDEINSMYELSPADRGLCLQIPTSFKGP